MRVRFGQYRQLRERQNIIADRVSIAIRTEQAIDRLEKSMAVFAEQIELDAVEIPRRHNDLDMLRALQLEALANWVDAAVEAYSVPPESIGEPVSDDDAASMEDAEVEDIPEDYASLTKADLVVELHNRKIALESITGTGANGNILVEDIRAALMADDEQAQSDDTPTEE